MDEGDAVRRMVVIGDSICFGQFVYPHKTWVHLLSQVAPMPIDNFSWCGDTTRTALERSLPLVQRDGCDVAYVQFGCNDANKWDTDLGLPRVSVGAFAANLHEIVARCRAAGASEVVIGTNHKTNIDTSAYLTRRDITPTSPQSAPRSAGKHLHNRTRRHPWAGSPATSTVSPSPSPTRRRVICDGALPPQRDRYPLRRSR